MLLFLKRSFALNKKLLLIILALALILFIIVGGAMLLSNNANNQTNNTTGKSNNTTVEKQNITETQKIIAESKNVILTPLGFNPQTVTIKSGGRVVWTNQSGEKGTVNSDPYPTNSLWKFLNLGSFDDGTNVSVNFESVGKYTYHNQLKPAQTATVIVQ